MSLPEKVFAACMIVAGCAAVWCTVVAWVCDWRDRRREAAQVAAARGRPLRACARHDVIWCTRCTTSDAPAVVASDDLDPLERLWLAPAYGEEHAS